MDEHNIRLSSPEIGGLWAYYIQESLSICLLKYFLYHLKDDELRTLLQKSLHHSETNLKGIEQIFSTENIPIPDGFTDKDIDLSAPPLFYDTFALSLVYSIARMGMVNNAFLTGNIARSDVLNLFANSVKEYTDLYKESVNLLLTKGIYDRPPMIPYPEKNEYIQHKSYVLNFLDGKRPLNALELTELFFNIERNYFSVLLCQAFIQVVKDKEIKEFIKEGKKISEKQIKFCNEVLIKEDLLGTVPVTMDITNSTISPFSDKLIVALFHLLNSVDISLLGHSLSLSMRVDLTTSFSKYMGEILIYADKGFNIMVDRGWMEKPPQSPNRKELGNS